MSLLLLPLLLSCRAPAPTVPAGDSGDSGLDGGPTSSVPDRPPLGDPVGPCPAGEACWRFVSMPDFLNCDVGSLAGLPSWDGGADSTSEAWEVAMDQVIDTAAALEPDLVLVAGDMVNGHWDQDTDGRALFGPVGTFLEQEAAIRAAGALYHPVWRERFEARGLEVHVTTGDHELGDNDWPAGSAAAWNVPLFREVFARHHTQLPDGGPRYALRPVDSPQADSAWAFEHEGVLIVGLDVFRQDQWQQTLDSETGTVLATVDGAQLSWLEALLAEHPAEHVLVMGHTPVLGPVRTVWSSGLMLRDHDGTPDAALADQGADTDLWRALDDSAWETEGVRLFLAGEVHDTTLVQDRQGGPVQIAHGAHLGRSSTFTWLLGTVSSQRIDLQLFEARLAHDGDPLWQTSTACDAGAPRFLEQTPRLAGTARVEAGSGLTVASGRLAPP